MPTDVTHLLSEGLNMPMWTFLEN